MKAQTKGKIKWIILILVILILLAVAAFFAVKASGRNSMTGNGDETVQKTAPETEDVILEDDGETVVYKGKKYRYNENITSILCMGVDNENAASDDTVIGSAGQADMLMLAILDTDNGKVSLWNISRDSMTEVDIYNTDGEYVRTETLQACLAFGYGDGKERSCENTVRAVSRLLYGMPIQSYAVINMNAIRPLNDAVGGVEVTIHEEDILPSRFQAGTTVLLKGDDVEAYVRSRRTEAPDEAIDTNNNRMARQRQYMMNFIQKALQMTKKDMTTPITLFNIAQQEGDMTTNLTISKVVYLTELVTKINFTEDSFRTVPGEVVAGEKYAEYYVDDEALYEMIINTFYVPE